MAFSLFESTLLVPKTEFKIDMENFFESRYTNLRIQCEETHHLKEVGVFSTEINRGCRKTASNPMTEEYMYSIEIVCKTYK